MPTYNSPADALDASIATVYQDRAMVPLMSVTCNFFMGREPTKGFGFLQRVDWRQADRIALDEMCKIGIDVRDPSQPVGTLSGGERQCVAIARTVYFGARILILDEPTSALGVRQAAVAQQITRRLVPQKRLHHLLGVPVCRRMLSEVDMDDAPMLVCQDHEHKEPLKWVFHQGGYHIGIFQRAWNQACKRSGVNRVFHDLRRTAVRNIVYAGVPEKVVRSITGHQTRMVFDRYMIVKTDDQRRVWRRVFGQ